MSDDIYIDRNENSKFNHMHHGDEYATDGGGHHST